jgi:uncharacterized membrane protein YqiK
MGALAQRVPHLSPMDTQRVTTEADVTEIEERSELQKEQTKILQEQMNCECPDQRCQVAHES